MLVTQYNINYYMIEITIHKFVVTVALHSTYKNRKILN